MQRTARAHGNPPSGIRAALLLAAVSTYFIEPTNVVWALIGSAPNARVWEHICFGLAAAALGLSIWLRMTNGGERYESGFSDSRPQRISSDLLQAVGIGSLMPLAGFILLISAELVLAMLRHARAKQVKSRLAQGDTSKQHLVYTVSQPSAGWRESLAEHIGLCCAFVSMVIFSITLSDRLADYLFAGAALIGVVASLLRRRARTSNI